jgi:hypothetical protein
VAVVLAAGFFVALVLRFFLVRDDFPAAFADFDFAAVSGINSSVRAPRARLHAAMLPASPAA